MNQIDLVILGIMAVFLFLGYRKGLVGSILSLVQYILIAFFSFQLTKPVAGFLITNLHLDEIIINRMFRQTEIVETQLTMLSNDIIQMFVGRIINVIAFLLVFIVLKIAFRIVFFLLNQVFQLPILNEVNRLAGILLGGVEGVLIVYILITLINWLPLPSLETTKNALASSFIGNKINDFVPTVASEIINNVNIKDVANFGES
ncbi:MAG: CvpA family protein [Clostridia bacterium]|nr:CvpA family protein [Clostridia bacterium]